MIIGIFGLMLLYIILKVLKVSAKIIFKLLVNGVMGLFLLFVFNLVGGAFNIYIEMNSVNSLVAGFFGIPGIILLLLFN
ncbi:MAG: pro-sigmaK processing inhibitor BofA family protein [Tissierellia bacterium]|nr:pro-sigmaK processing inhibitor BofA family protein [Tissierellia bacterium]